jgi:transposase
VPAMPVSLFAPIWEQFSVLLPTHPTVVPTHPLGCHRRRVPDRVVFEHIVAALVHGSGYERIATPGCSDRTIRRRLREWANAGLAQRLHALVVEQYDRMIGLECADLALDGCITKAPRGGDKAGRSPVDRGKQGLKRSVVTEAAGVPLHLVSAGANRHDAPLLAPTLAGLSGHGPLPPEVTVHLDRGYDSADPCRAHGLRLHRGDRPPRAAGSRPRQHAVGGRTDPRLDERLWQAAPVHGNNRSDG